jgi:hypothetical protein
MLKKPSSVFTRLLDRIGKVPVVDCHEHLRGPRRDLVATPTEPIAALTTLYCISDLWAAGASDEDMGLLQSDEATTDEKWPVFIELWTAAEHTAYARVTKIALREAYGIREITREAMDPIAERLSSRSESDYMKILEFPYGNDKLDTSEIPNSRPFSMARSNYPICGTLHFLCPTFTRFASAISSIMWVLCPTQISPALRITKQRYTV